MLAYRILVAFGLPTSFDSTPTAHLPLQTVLFACLLHLLVKYSGNPQSMTWRHSDVWQAMLMLAGRSFNRKLDTHDEDLPQKKQILQAFVESLMFGPSEHFLLHIHSLVFVQACPEIQGRVVRRWLTRFRKACRLTVRVTVEHGVSRQDNF